MNTLLSKCRPRPPGLTSSSARPFIAVKSTCGPWFAQAQVQKAAGNFTGEHNLLVGRVLIGVPHDVGHRLVRGQHDLSPFQVGETGGERPTPR